MARVLITGATGTIGRALTSSVLARGDTVVALSRDERRGREALGDSVEVHAWPEPATAPPPASALRGADAVVNLLGATVAQRWTPQAKRAIQDSRVLGTRLLVEALVALPGAQRPSTLVSQSATGFYGPRDQQPINEETPAGSDFLAEVVRAWEHEALAAARQTRVVLTRTGMVLAPGGGALAKMLPFFRLGLGGPVAGGEQYVPWVHLDDVVGALLRCLYGRDVRGPVNVTAPNPVTNAELSRALGRALGRPAVLPVPGLALQVLYGEMAQIVTSGQRALPERLRSLGYEFRHPEVEAALRDVLRRA